MTLAFSAGASVEEVLSAWEGVAGQPAAFASVVCRRWRRTPPVVGSFVGASLGAWALAPAHDDGHAARVVRDEVRELALYAESLVEEDLRLALETPALRDASLLEVAAMAPDLAAERSKVLVEVLTVGVLLRGVPAVSSEVLNVGSGIRYVPFHMLPQVVSADPVPSRSLLPRPPVGALEVEVMRLESVRDALVLLRS